MNKIFTGRSVALIGPAPHILERKQDFSSFDLVVRTNTSISMLPEANEATGDRCDVLYIAVIKDWMRKAPAMARVKEIRIKNSQLWHAEPRIKDVFFPWRDKVRMVDSDREAWLTQQVGCDPNVGFLAAVDILFDGATRLYITGFTFFQGVAHYQGYRNAHFTENLTKLQGETELHKQKPQLDFFVKHIRPLVEVDDQLNQICERHEPS